MYVISLITGKVLYQYGNGDGFALRSWSAFDSSPLVDAETDTLIWPGENGVLYTIKLNTAYDKEAGTIEVNPDKPVKTRYRDNYSKQNRYVGYEDSVVVVDHWLYVADNAGMFYCVDLNTMELVWAQDTKDDNNSSPVFEWDDEGNGYIYTAPSLHWTKNSSSKGTLSVYKLDAATGKIVWEYERECVRYDDIAGGVQCSPLIGREGTNIGGLIIYSIARTPSAYRGVLIALDKETGEKIWEISSGNYAWSSPVALYTEDGHSYIFLANASGVARLIDGATGEVLATLDFRQTVEASPVVFGNMLVIGSREAVYGIKIS
jgi:outer membrane protein assembly factor BamB